MRNNFERQKSEFEYKKKYYQKCIQDLEAYKKAMEPLCEKYPNIIPTYIEESSISSIRDSDELEEKDFIRVHARLHDEPGERVDISRVKYDIYLAEEAVSYSIYYKETITVNSKIIELDVDIVDFLYNEAASVYIDIDTNLNKRLWFCEPNVLLTRLKKEVPEFLSEHNEKVIQFITKKPYRISNPENVPEDLRSKINTIINFS